MCVYLRKLLDCNLFKLIILWSRLHVFSTFSLLQHEHASTKTYIVTVMITYMYSSIVCNYKEPQHCLSSIKFPKTNSLSASDLARQTTSTWAWFFNRILTLYNLHENYRMHEMFESYFCVLIQEMNHFFWLMPKSREKKKCSDIKTRILTEILGIFLEKDYLKFWKSTILLIKSNVFVTYLKKTLYMVSLRPIQQSQGTTVTAELTLRRTLHAVQSNTAAYLHQHHFFGAEERDVSVRPLGQQRHQAHQHHATSHGPAHAHSALTWTHIHTHVHILYAYSTVRTYTHIEQRSVSTLTGVVGTEARQLRNIFSGGKERGQSK